jgi:hypothetical protein
MAMQWKLGFIHNATIVLLGGMVGLAGFELLATAPVQAYEARLSVTLDLEPNETFQTLMKRAEVVARAAVQRAFDTDILATDASIFINGRSGGLEAPLLSVQISRFQWQSFPDARRWATYYPSTQGLLRLDPPVTVSEPALQPGSTLAPSTRPTPQGNLPSNGGFVPGSVTPGTSGNVTPGVPGTTPQSTSPDSTVPNSIQLAPPDTIRPIDVPTTAPSSVPDELLNSP